MVFVKIVYLKPLTKHITLLRDLEAATVLEALGVVPKTQWPSTEALMHELSTDSEVTFRTGLGSAEVLTTRPGVDPLEVTRPLPDFSWTTQSPIATSPSIMVRPGIMVCSLLRRPTCSVLRPPRSNRKHGI